MMNILLVGVTTGIELESDGRSPAVTHFVGVVSNSTLAVFTLEVFFKAMSEGYEPWRYITDPENGAFNTFDLFIVLGSYIFLSSGGSGGAIGALRMLRLIRLLTFVKNVPQLRVIIAGLLQVNRLQICLAL